MSKIFETGHAKNVANFEKLVGFCESYGANYNPGAENILLQSIQNLQNDAQDALLQTENAKTNFNKVVNNRNLEFDDTKTLSTKILNAFMSSGADELTINDLQGINRKIQGKRATPKKDDPDGNETPGDDKTISVSQQSFDNRLTFYKSIFSLLSAEPLYKPNETELSLAGLKLKISDMQTANTSVIKATSALSNARIHRNKILYDEKDGLLQIAKNIKKYIKSVFGANSEEVDQVNMLVFVDKNGK